VVSTSVLDYVLGAMVEYRMALDAKRISGQSDRSGMRGRVYGVGELDKGESCREASNALSRASGSGDLTNCAFLISSSDGECDILRGAIKATVGPDQTLSQTLGTPDPNEDKPKI
jgi:hypothetical protein